MPSLRARAMSAWLRRTEKRQLARENDVAKLRKSFELKARLSFFAPRAARFDALQLGPLPALRVTLAARSSNSPVILYFHGGAYIIGSPRTHRAMLAHLLRFTGGWAVLPDYRKAPENPFPAAIEDALAAYQSLLKEGHAPSDVVLGGDSAGGGLALALLGEICRLKLPRPKALFALSPYTDFTFSGASYSKNAKADAVLPVSRLEEQRRQYLAGVDPKDPRASPVFADFSGACPVFITVGDSEILLDDSRAVAAKLRADGAEVTLIEEVDLPHVWPLFQGYIPEAKRSLGKLADWLSSLPRPLRES